MGSRSVARFACDWTGPRKKTCSAVVEVEGTAYDVEVRRKHLPEGWALSEPGRLNVAHAIVACPEHAPELRAAEAAKYAWEVAEVDARNAWVKANPPPQVPAWLGGPTRGRR